MNHSLDRRRFLQQTVAAAATSFVSAPGLLAARAWQDPAPLEPVRLGVFGAGGRGWGNLQGLADQTIVALCDVDLRRSNGARERYPDARFFQDYRACFEEVGDELEAVVVSTPDHMHAPIAMEAMRRGLHCYCEKPLTWSVEEARAMRRLGEDRGLVTQMGNGGSASNGLRAGVEVLRAGVLGAVKEVHVWTNRPVWPQAMAVPTEAESVPEHLDWDLFLGCAEERAYHGVYHPFSWRGWYDFGTGALGDMACHTMNLPARGLELGSPARVEATSTKRFAESFPAGSHVTWHFAAVGERPAFPMHWYDGTMSPPQGILDDREVPGSGSLVVCERGSLFSPGDNGTWFELLGPDGEEFVLPEPWLPRSPGHHREWIEAIRGRGAAFSGFAEAGPLTELVLLGNLALRAGKPIPWDGKALRAAGAPELEPLIRRPYRSGFGMRA